MHVALFLSLGVARLNRHGQVTGGIDGDEITGDYHDGVLTIHLPKPEEAKPKRFQIGTRHEVIEAPQSGAGGSSER